MSMSQDQDVSKKEYENVSSYKDFKIEITKMCRLSPPILPAVIGAMRFIKRLTPALEVY